LSKSPRGIDVVSLTLGNSLILVETKTFKANNTHVSGNDPCFNALSR
jgi:hypothetical protein